MGCIDCEVPVAVTGGEREGETKREGKGGIWRSADYAEQTQQLAENTKTFTNHRWGEGERQRKGDEMAK